MDYSADGADGIQPARHDARADRPGWSFPAGNDQGSARFALPANGRFEHLAPQAIRTVQEARLGPIAAMVGWQS